MPTRGGSAAGLYVSLKPILPQNQLPVTDGSLVLAPKSFLDHEGLSLRAAILHSSSVSKARLDQEATSSRPCTTLLLTWPC